MLSLLCPHFSAAAMVIILFLSFFILLTCFLLAPFPALASATRSLLASLLSPFKASRSIIHHPRNLIPLSNSPSPSIAPMSANASAPTARKSSYTYWVRQNTQQAPPVPLPRKLSDVELAQIIPPAPLGSVWNQAGTWEEKNLTQWATKRIKELLITIEPLKFPAGKARVTEISSCVGEATLITVRSKKRVGYSYVISMKFKGDWKETKDLEGTLMIPEASFGDLDEMQLEVTITKGKGITSLNTNQMTEALKLFLPVIRGKLQTFEEELKGR